MAIDLVVVVENPAPYTGCHYITVPSAYGGHNALPEHMAILVLDAAQSLQLVYEKVVAAGGVLYLSDCFRSFEEQDRAYHDWLYGKKSAYSPPPCSSVHEAARAIDIDAYHTVIGHAKVREILNGCGWVNITPSLTANECWHYEYYDSTWAEYKRVNGYAQMARKMKEDIGNVSAQPAADQHALDIIKVQQMLNAIMGLHLVLTGVYTDEMKNAVRQFQVKYGLQADGVAGPITKAKLHELYKP